MTIPDGYVIFVEGYLFFLIEMLRPKEDVPGNYIEGKAWHWSLWSQNGAKISWGYVKNRGTCKSSAKRAARSWLKRNERKLALKRQVVKKIELTEQHIQAIEAEVKMMLHASRDAMRNRGEDTLKYRFDCRDGYYGEAFGIMRTLAVLGYGRIDGAVNTPEDRTNLKWWFGELEREVLKEENFEGSRKCAHCMERYGKDDSTVGKREVQCPACRGNGKVNIAGQTDVCGHCHGVGKVSKEVAENYGHDEGYDQYMREAHADLEGL